MGQDEMYINFANHLKEEGCSELVDELKLGKVEAYDIINEATQTLDEKNLDKFYQSRKLRWGVSVLDLSKLDLSNIPAEKLKRIVFTNKTIWPSKDKLPKGFEPTQILNKAKSNIGYGVEQLHKQGINGKGVTIAYIDANLKLSHEEFKGLNIEYNATSTGDEYHACAVLSRLAGVNSGIAPKSKIIFYGTNGLLIRGNFLESLVVDRLNSLKNIIKRVKNNEKIDMIGMSSSLEFNISTLKESNNPNADKYQKEFNTIQKELIELNIPLIDSPCFWDSGFAYAWQLDTTKDFDNKENYISRYTMNTSKVCVIDADKCIPMPYTNDGYVYENQIGCASWSIPQVVGLFALAKQVDGEITFEEFTKICKFTADKPNKYGVKLLNAVEMIKEVEIRLQNRIEEIL